MRDVSVHVPMDADELARIEETLLLGHADESQTAAYRRKRVGERAKPIMRVVSAKTGSS